MRINQPVTQREFELEDGATLVSTTDLQSRITYCNAAFVRVSGFEREELIGQPHNVVRHPDMPAEAFRDMWTTLRAGQPWSALVKNRRKNGDHYWVVANATPIVENGRPVGYMSVRTKPTREQVRQAEALYARMRAEAADGRRRVALQGGRVVATGLRGRLQAALRLGLTGRFVFALAALGLASLALAALLPVETLAGWTGKALAVAALSALLGGWLHRVVTRPLEHAVTLANRIAAGDLTQSVVTERTDEVGRLLRSVNQLNVNLQAIVGDVRRQVEAIDGAARDIADGNRDLASRTETQASSLQQTASAIGQLAGTVRQNAESAGVASRLAGEATSVAQRGGDAVGQVVQTMRGIEDSSRRIADIIQVIDGIAFQTNILALNAAVEAARAGEQGRGFAVVAGEVRALAQRTAGAAREVKSLIGESVQRVASGTQMVETAGTTMQDIMASVTRVSRLIETITAASAEQAGGIGQVNQAVDALEGTTQQNSALVEQNAASATVLGQQSTALKESVAIFKLAQRGASAPAHPA